MENGMGVLSREEIAAFEALGTGQVCDAMETIGLRRSVILGLRFVAPEDAVLVGVACTARQAPKREPATKEQRLVTHDKLTTELGVAGQVVCLEVSAPMQTGTWGDMLNRNCQQRGIRGLLTNGNIRDARATRRAGFPVFCGGFSPIKSQWDMETVGLNQPITIGMVQIRPGDVVFGDEDGVLVIPFDRRTAVLDLALDIQRKERAALG